MASSAEEARLARYEWDGNTNTKDIKSYNEVKNCKKRSDELVTRQLRSKFSCVDSFSVDTPTLQSLLRNSNVVNSNLSCSSLRSSQIMYNHRTVTIKEWNSKTPVTEYEVNRAIRNLRIINSKIDLINKLLDEYEYDKVLEILNSRYGVTQSLSEQLAVLQLRP